MPDKNHRKRYEITNQPRFVTFSCFQRLALFNNDRIKDHFLKHLSRLQSSLQFKIHAWVIMPEHVHLIITPNLPQLTLSKVLEKIKGPFAKEVIKRWRELNAPVPSYISDRKGKPHFWQAGGGYDRNIRDHVELIEKIEYINDNPRRRGLVNNALDYRWSSARFYAGQSSCIFGLDSA